MPTHELVPAAATPLDLLAQHADAYARATVFADYLAGKAANTRRAQLGDLATFSAFLTTAGLPQPPSADALQTAPTAWAGITYGLVKAFADWQLAQGAALASINRRLATLRKYAALAYQAGSLSESAYALMRTVQAYGSKAGRHLDQQRTAQGVPTRRGAKKAAPTALTPSQAAALKMQPDTPQGRRDALLLCLLLDHGLRVGEVATLRVGDLI